MAHKAAPKYVWSGPQRAVVVVYAKTYGQTAAALQFGITDRTVRRWEREFDAVSLDDIDVESWAPGSAEAVAAHAADAERPPDPVVVEAVPRVSAVYAEGPDVPPVPPAPYREPARREVAPKPTGLACLGPEDAPQPLAPLVVHAMAEMLKEMARLSPLLVQGGEYRDAFLALVQGSSGLQQHVVQLAVLNRDVEISARAAWELAQPKPASAAADG